MDDTRQVRLGYIQVRLSRVIVRSGQIIVRSGQIIVRSGQVMVRSGQILVRSGQILGSLQLGIGYSQVRRNFCVFNIFYTDGIMEELLCFQYMENTKAPINKSPKRRYFCVLSLLLLLCFMLTAIGVLCSREIKVVNS